MVDPDREGENALEGSRVRAGRRGAGIVREVHMIISRLIERVEISKGYKMNIKFRISLNQFLGQEA